MPEPPVINDVVCGDCIEWLNAAPAGWADLVFADPPFNIGYKYDVYEDVKAYDEYFAWTEAWMKACTRALTDTGTFWVAIGDEYAAEVRLIGRKLGLTLRNWVVWHYTFGQNTRRKFARSHAHLFYFVKDPVEFTFNDAAVRTFSDRQRVYRDKRANPLGKIPDDTWTEFPRVCGTFGEREGWHPCQMPVSLLERIVRACSNVDDLVFDPFAGSGTTLVAARRQGRRYAGTEMSGNYVTQVRRRLAETPVLADIPKPSNGDWHGLLDEQLKTFWSEAAISMDTLETNEHLMGCFAEQFSQRLALGGSPLRMQPGAVLDRLVKLGRANQLPIVKVHTTQRGGSSRTG